MIGEGHAIRTNHPQYRQSPHLLRGLLLGGAMAIWSKDEIIERMALYVHALIQSSNDPEQVLDKLNSSTNTIDVYQRNEWMFGFEDPDDQMTSRKPDEIQVSIADAKKIGVLRQDDTVDTDMLQEEYPKVQRRKRLEQRNQSSDGHEPLP